MPVGSCTHVLWDFNGTLLDDLDVAVAAVSDMLVSRGREPMTRAWYYELMEMPIIRYYEKLFDLSQVPFETLSREFVEGYARHFSLARSAALRPRAAGRSCFHPLNSSVCSPFYRNLSWQTPLKRCWGPRTSGQRARSAVLRTG